MNARIPVTILSGYLGAGKTTLINHALAQPHGLRLAVLVNDFGPVNIDASLIRSRDATTIALSNGCVCCTIGDDLGDALTAISDWPEPPDHVLLEASGVAEPARIARTAGYWPGFTLDAIIVAADAETVEQRSRDKFTGTLVRSQLKSADIVALTKTDIIGEPALASVRTWLSGELPAPKIINAPHGTVPAALLFGHIGDSTPQKTPPPDQPVTAHAHDHPHYATTFWRPDGPVNIARLRSTLTDLPASIHRAKGFVTEAETSECHLVQCVGNRCEITKAPTFSSPGIVLISTGPDGTLEEACSRMDQTIGGVSARLPLRIFRSIVLAD